MKEPSNLFKNAVFVGGGVIATCGFCSRVHYCLDDPGESFESVSLDLGEVDEGKLRESFAKMIRGADSQQDQGVNGVFDPDSLLELLDNSRLVLVPQLGGNWLEVLQTVFRCEEADAVALDARREEAKRKFSATELEAHTFQAVPHIGSESIAIGAIDGRKVVEGCCEETVAKYESCFWQSKKVIADYLALRAMKLTQEAQHVGDLADKARTAAPEEEEEA